MPSLGSISVFAVVFAVVMVAVRAWALMLFVAIVRVVWLPHMHTLGYLYALALVALASLAFGAVKVNPS